MKAIQIISIFLILMLIPEHFIFSQGDVGVGVTSPEAKLHINEANNPFKNPLRVDYASLPKLVVGTNGGTSIGTGFGASPNGLYVHENLGVGVTNPTDKLSVAGDMNITGEIKANGDSGNPGQYLTPNTAGQMEWTNSSEYKNTQGFKYTGSQQNWTVPEGVTEIEIEMWGGGEGGANRYFGGQAGGFIRIKIMTTPFSILLITIGKGGDGRDESVNPDIPEEAGGNTLIVGPGLNATAYGGQTDTPNGGSFVASQLTDGTYWGADGTNSDGGETIIHELSSPVKFISRGGRGGLSYPFEGVGADGGESFIGFSGIFENIYGKHGKMYGSGGGNAPFNISGDGAGGYVKIKW